MRKFLGFATSTLLVVALVGCNKPENATPYADAEEAPAGGGEHGHAHGPHGGHIVELAEDHSVHGEFVIDEAAKVATFYVLGEDLKTPVEASAVSMHATTAEGEATVEFKPAGGGETASEFTIALDQLPTSDIEALEGHFHVTADGKELAGELTHDHGHKHDHEHAEGEHEHSEGEHEHAEGEEGHDHAEEAPAPAP